MITNKKFITAAVKMICRARIYILVLEVLHLVSIQTADIAGNRKLHKELSLKIRSSGVLVGREIFSKYD